MISIGRRQRRFGLAAIALTASCLAVGCAKGSSSAPTSPGGGGNHAPSVYITGSPTRLALGSSASFTTTASDQDGDQLTFSYVGQNGSVTVSGNTATSGTFTGAARGNASVIVTASDGHGGTAQATASFYNFSTAAPSPTIAQSGSGCSTFTISSAESLQVLVVVTERISGRQDLVVPNDFTPGLLAAGQSVSITPDDCGHSSGDIWIVSYDVQRPHDGVTFSFTKQWTF